MSIATYLGTSTKPHKVPTPQTSLSPTYSLQGGLNPVWCTGSKGGGQHHTTLTSKEIKCTQDIVGTLLYYAQAVDPTLLAALNAIAAC